MKLPIDSPRRPGTKRCGHRSPNGATPAAPACPIATVAPRRATVARRGSAIIA